MSVYLDVIFFINFAFDYLLLTTVSIVLKRNIRIIRIFTGALLGSLSTFLLFLNLNSFELFIFKFLISILMILITFKYKNLNYLIKNLTYLYLISMLLGGFLYFIDVETSYKNNGIIFYFNGVSTNIIILLILSPIIMFFYIKTSKELKNNYSYYHEVNIYIDNKKISLTAYLDTGNKLKDPFFNRPIMIVNECKISKKYLEDYFLVPVDTINNHNLIKCISVDKVVVDNKELIKKVVVGISPNKIKMEGIDCIFGAAIMEK